MIETIQEKDANLNKNIYLPQKDDIGKFEQYFKSTFTNEMKYLLRDEFIYVLNHKEGEITDEDGFNPETYEFSEGDYRMSIKYVNKKIKILLIFFSSI